MALFNYKSLQEKTIPSHESYDYISKYESRSANLNSIEEDSFDIFLSHSFQDKEIIPALKHTLEDMGYSVYVDWITDRLLSRNDVNKETAEVLQKRMQQSKCLIYATSDNSKNSRWMPWELGYFDGIKTRMVSILPIKKNDNSFNNDFKGEEYLGLYYYITIDKLSRYLEHTVMAMDENSLKSLEMKFSKIDRMFINENSFKFVVFDDWLNGTKPYSLDDEFITISEELKR